MKSKVKIEEPNMRLVGRRYTETVLGYKRSFKIPYFGYTLAIGKMRVPLCSDAVSLIGHDLAENEIMPIKKIIIHFGCEDEK